MERGLIIAGVVLFLSCALLVLEKAAPRTRIGRLARRMLDIRIIPRAMTGSRYEITGRRGIWIGIGWKFIFCLSLGVLLAIQKCRLD